MYMCGCDCGGSVCDHVIVVRVTVDVTSYLQVEIYIDYTKYF